VSHSAPGARGGTHSSLTKRDRDPTDETRPPIPRGAVGLGGDRLGVLRMPGSEVLRFALRAGHMAEFRVE
jgi:hypothetical protein